MLLLVAIVMSVTLVKSHCFRGKLPSDPVMTEIDKKRKKIDRIRKWSEVFTFHIPAKHYTQDSFEGECYYKRGALKKIIVKTANTNILYFRTFYRDNDQLIFVKERSFIYEDLNLKQELESLETTEAYARSLPGIKERYFNNFYFNADTLYRHLDNDNGQLGEKMQVMADTNFSRRLSNGILKEYHELLEKASDR